jgi:hypothetical protein
MWINLILLNSAVIGLLVYFQQPVLTYILLIAVNIAVAIFMYLTRNMSFGDSKKDSREMFPNESITESHNFAKFDRPMHSFSDVDDDF